MKINVACIQNCASRNMEQTVADATDLCRDAASDGAQLLCLPEFFSYLHLDNEGLEVGAHDENDHPALTDFLALADELSAWILLGSLAVYDWNGNKRNRSIVVNPQGTVVARYDKIHMFDVNLPNGEVYRESDVFEPGSNAVTVNLSGAVLGLTVCYDLRFAYLYRALAHAGASIISVPAAFTRTTGKAHWHVLLRSRAIETGSYIVAPCQFGDHGKARTYGHSLIIDPWGRVIADCGENRGYIMAKLDMKEVTKARQMIPALEHDREFTLPVGSVTQLREAS